MRDKSLSGPVLFCDGKRPFQHVVYTGGAQCPACKGFAARIADEDDRDRVLGGLAVPTRPVREVPVPDEQLPFTDPYLKP